MISKIFIYHGQIIKIFKHGEKWGEYESGEGDYLAEISIKKQKIIL
ncbi:MAG: hypothetical protein ACO2ON_00385 [Candidatus Nanopusillus sp.]